MILALGTACGSGPDLEAERTRLLRLQEVGRTAHLEKRAALITATMADSFLEVSRGAVERRTPEQVRERMQAYLERSTFQEWDDIAPPIVRVAPDGRMAYVVVQKRVRRTEADSAGTPRADHTVFAWVEIYQKLAGHWTLMLVASTDRPG
jgi:hypothetical protein